MNGTRDQSIDHALEFQIMGLGPNHRRERASHDGRGVVVGRSATTSKEKEEFVVQFIL